MSFEPIYFTAGDTFNHRARVPVRNSDDDIIDLTGWTASAVITFPQKSFPNRPVGITITGDRATGFMMVFHEPADKTADWPAGIGEIYIDISKGVAPDRVVLTSTKLKLSIRARAKIG